MSDDRPQTHDCLDAETLAAFIDGRLEPREREVVEAHLAGCEDCYEVWMEGITASLPNTTTGRPWRHALVAGAAAVVLATAGLSVWLSHGSNERPELSDLAKAVGPQRMTVARIDGPFTWAPPPAPARSGTTRAVLPPEADIALGRIRKTLERERTARTLAALGAARLLYGQTDEAVEALEGAVALDDQFASAWSDLSAAYLERSALDGHEIDVPRSVEAAERALDLDPMSEAAVFNLALARERLNANPVPVWERYLTLDATSGWADEARRSIAAWKAKTPSEPRDQQAARDRLLYELTSLWLSGGTRARSFADGTALLEELAASPQDRVATRVWEHLSLSRTADADVALSRGIRDLLEGRKAYQANQFVAAGPMLERAERALWSAGSPLAAFAALTQGLVAYRLEDLDEASAIMSRLLTRTADWEAPSLHGQIESNLGLIAGAQVRRRSSIEHYERAAAAFAKAHEHRRAAFVHGLIATQYDLLGDDIRSWTHRLVALEGSPREGTWLTAADAAIRAGWLNVAAAMHDVAVQYARTQPAGPSLIDVFRMAAIRHAQDGRQDEARALITEAEQRSAQFTGVVAERTRAEVAGTRAEVEALGGTDPRSALADADFAIGYFERTGAVSRLPALLLARARLQRALGEATHARASLDRGLMLHLNTLGKLAGGPSLGTYGSVLRKLADEAVAIEMSSGRPWEALEVLALVRDVGRRGAPALSPWTAASLQSAMPERLVLAAFMVGDDRTHIWVIRRDRMLAATINFGKSALRQLARGLTHRRFDAVSAQRLREAVLDPISGMLERNDTLLIVPDGPLHTVPFAALPGQSTRYLIEEHAIALAPHFDLRGSPTLPDGDALVVGNPAYDTGRFGSLRPLPGAEREAESVASLLGDRAVLLTAGRATVPAILQRLPDAALVHFAGHAMVNDRVPGHSQLVIGSGLSAATLESLTLSRRPLVLLAACESTGGVMTDAEGPLGLARSLLRAGASTVVANHWPVDDERMSSLMVEFHSALQPFGNGIQALRVAQIAAAKKDDSAGRTPYWAGVVAITASLPTISVR